MLWALSAGRIPLALGVLQILCLDLVTDQLPALVLGSEPPPEGTIIPGSPRGRHLVDRELLWRVFGVLGPAEAVVELAAFTAVLVLAGYRLGGSIPREAVLPASASAFLAVIVGQAVNSFACRSAARPAWGLAAPRALFVLAAAFGGLGFVIFVYVPRLASRARTRTAAAGRGRARPARGTGRAAGGRRSQGVALEGWRGSSRHRRSAFPERGAHQIAPQRADKGTPIAPSGEHTERSKRGHSCLRCIERRTRRSRRTC